MGGTENLQEGDVARLRAQDADAFATLVNEHQSMIVGMCHSLGLRGADIEEAATVVFANVYRSLPGFDGRAELSTWLYRIACRTIVRERTRLRRHQPTVPLTDQIAASQTNPEEALEAAELREQLWAVVAGLPAREALATEMYYRRDWPVAKIAAVLQCPRGTVKTLLFRARRRLRDILAAKGIEP